MTKQVIPPYNWRFWPAYGIHMRPYLLFISGVAGLSGIALASAAALTEGRLLLAFLPLFLSYGFGQALTDCFQVDTDRLSAPYRPISQGLLSPRDVGLVSLLGLLAGVGLLVYLNPRNAVLGLLAIFGLATYTFFKRRYWLIGPFYNAWIVAMLPLIGYLAVSGGGWPAGGSRLWAVTGLSFVAYTNFVLMGYLKDIRADRATGYRTFAVLFGWDLTVWVGDALALLAAVLAGRLVWGHPLAMAVWVLAGLMALAGQGFAHRTPDKTEANAAFPIVATVRSFILWHLAVVVVFEKAWWPALLVFYLLFELVLWQRPSREQV